MIRIGNTFAECLRSNRSAPWAVAPIRLDLVPVMRGYVLTVKAEFDAGQQMEGFATAHDLRELSAMFAAAADVLEAGAAA